MIDQRMLRASLLLLQLRTEKELRQIPAWKFWKWTKRGQLKNHLTIIEILLEDDEYIMLSAIPKELQEKLLTLKP